MSREANCECALRSFWDGPCGWCIANPEVLPPLDYQQLARNAQFKFQECIDKIVTDAAIELGYQAGQHVAEAWNSAMRENL